LSWFKIPRDACFWLYWDELFRSHSNSKWVAIYDRTSSGMCVYHSSPFYILHSGIFIVSRAASFLSVSFRLSELPQTAEKNTATTILRWNMSIADRFFARIKMGIQELHHKRGERLYHHCENSTSWKIPPVCKYFSSSRFFAR